MVKSSNDYRLASKSAKTGIKHYPGRQHEYTVWVNGEVVYFTNELDKAITTLERWERSVIDGHHTNKDGHTP